MSETIIMPEEPRAHLPPLPRDVTPPRQYRVSLRRDSTRGSKEDLPTIFEKNNLTQSSIQVAGRQMPPKLTLPTLPLSSRRVKKSPSSETSLAPAPRRSLLASSTSNAFNVFGGARLKRTNTQLSQESDTLRKGFERSRTFQTELKLFGHLRERSSDVLGLGDIPPDTDRSRLENADWMTRPLSTQKTIMYLFPSSKKRTRNRMPKWQALVNPDELEKLSKKKERKKSSPRIRVHGSKRKWYLGGMKVNGVSTGRLVRGDSASIDNDAIDATAYVTQRSYPTGRRSRRSEELRPQSVAMVLRYMEDLRSASPFQQLRPEPDPGDTRHRCTPEDSIYSEFKQDLPGHR